MWKWYTQNRTLVAAQHTRAVQGCYMHIIQNNTCTIKHHTWENPETIYRSLICSLYSEALDIERPIYINDIYWYIVATRIRIYLAADSMTHTLVNRMARQLICNIYTSAPQGLCKNTVCVPAPACNCIQEYVPLILLHRRHSSMHMHIGKCLAKHAHYIFMPSSTRVRSNPTFSYYAQACIQFPYRDFEPLPRN